MLRRLRSLGFSDSSALLIGDAVLYALSKAIPGFVGLFTIVIFVRLLGAEEFGRFSILGSTVLMWSAFASGWLNQGIIRYNSGQVIAGRGNGKELTKAVALSSLCCSLVVVLSFIIGGTRLGWHEFLLCSILAIFTVAQSVALAFFQSSLKPKLVLWLELQRTLGGFLLALAFAWTTGATPAALLAGMTIGYALSVGIAYLFAIKLFVLPSHRENSIVVRRLWDYGWPLSFWLGVQTAFPWFDRWFIERSLSLAETGAFASISDVVTRSFTLLVFPLTLAVHPRIVGLWNQNDHKAAFRLLGVALTTATLASVPIISAFHLGRHSLVNWLISDDQLIPEINAITESVGWLALSGVVWQLALFAHKPLELRSQTGTMLTLMAVALVVKIVLTVALLPAWGVKGLICGNLVSGLLYCLGCFLCAVRHHVQARTSS
jgi:O-antigen/teichoic acid export membrane protein